MKNQLKKCLSKIKFGFALPLDQSGQSIIILTFAFLGIIAMLGLALDMGLVYTNRVGLKRAIDAATLASVLELPKEEEAINVAINYLSANGYPNSNIYVAGCVQDKYNDFGQGTDQLMNWPFENPFYNDLLADGGQAPITKTLSTDPALFYHYVRYDPNGDGQYDDPGVASFFIDTRSFQVRARLEDGTLSNQDPQCNKRDQIDTPQPVSDGGPYGSASKIKISGQVPVRMNFMQFFGFGTVMVPDESVAQNASNLDVVVVMDVTGSMQFDTICYDCWERYGGNDKYQPYPRNGLAFPLVYDTLKDPYICGNGGNCNTVPVTPGDPKPQGANNYIIMEAELYSNNNSIWDPAFRGADVGYWAMQRSGSSAKSVDGRSAFVRHHPYLQESDTGNPFGHRYWLEDAQNGIAPRLEYDFMPTWSGSDDNTYIYLRVQAFTHGRNDNPDNTIYWAVDNGTIQENSSAPTSGDWQGDEDSWAWKKLNAGGLNENQIHTLKIWAGSPGYALDRIIITSQDTTSSALRNAAATPGTAQRMAADKCNPIYGENVVATDCSFIQLSAGTVNNLNDPLFGDLQPIRGSKEAIKAFVDRLDPALDQAGFVRFNTKAYQEAQLECLIASGVREANSTNEIDNYPLNASILGEFDETACFDEDEADAGTQPIRFQNILIGIENTSPNNSTDIADGLRRGLHMLGVTTDDDGDQTNDCGWDLDGSTWEIGNKEQPATNISSHCSRGAAATQVIVLLTDGAPTDDSPGDNDECKEDPIDPLPYDGFPDNDNKYRCILYYANIAGNNGVIVYSIGLGAGADPDLLGAVADRTNGQYYYAPSAAQLNIIFNQILANIYVRLVQ